VHPLLQRLLDLELPPGDWALFGSGPLLVRGWIDEVGDLDVIVRGPAWERAQQVGTSTELPDGIRVVEIDGGAITVGRAWRYENAPVSELIESAEMLDGIPCVRLPHIVAYKLIADRPKDRRHLAAMQQAGYDWTADEPAGGTQT
jgi:hypothetical protein